MPEQNDPPTTPSTPSIPSFEDAEKELGPDRMNFLSEMLTPEYKSEEESKEE